jgi:hypothetical protein
MYVAQTKELENALKQQRSAKAQWEFQARSEVKEAAAASCKLFVS